MSACEYFLQNKKKTCSLASNFFIFQMALGYHGWQSTVTEQNDVETRSTMQKLPHWKENISFTLLFLNAQKSNTQKVLRGSRIFCSWERWERDRWESMLMLTDVYSWSELTLPSWADENPVLAQGCKWSLRELDLSLEERLSPLDLNWEYSQGIRKCLLVSGGLHSFFCLPSS